MSLKKSLGLFIIMSAMVLIGACDNSGQSNEALFTEGVSGKGVVSSTNATVQFSISRWGSGYDGTVTITNKSNAKLKNWKLAFDWDHTISYSWSSKKLSTPAGKFEFTGSSWNSDIDAGQSVSFGFGGKVGPSLADPTAVVLTADSGPVDPIDKIKPSVPAGLKVTAKTSDSISVSWSASSDNVAVTGYQVKYYTGTALAKTVKATGLNTKITGLTADTLYSISVQAFDAAGNLSGYSAEISQRTDIVDPIDNIKPDVPAGLKVTAKSSSSISVSWNAAYDNVGVTGYQVKYYTGTALATVKKVTGLSYTITGLKANTTYKISVQAGDAAGNLSGYSAELSQKTDATNPVDPISGVTDGPYVFNRNGKVIVKYVANNKLVTRTFNSRAAAKFDVYVPNSNKKFSVTLKSRISVEPSTYTAPAKFLATSDIEGNFGAFEMLLKGAGVIDSSYNWTFGNGHLFICGDMFDRGTGVTESLWLLYRLESLAAAKGGKIHYILGNHDVMNLTGDFRYVASKYKTNMRIIGETLSSAYASDSELGKWIRSKNIIEKAGKFVFCHGGLSPAVQNLNPTFAKMNEYGRNKINGSCYSSACSTVTGGSSTGIYWYRGMTKRELTQSQVDSIARTFGFDHIILGHTVFTDITPLYNSKVIAIDIRHSSTYPSYMKALFYENGTMYKLRTSGSSATKTPIR